MRGLSNKNCSEGHATNVLFRDGRFERHCLKCEGEALARRDADLSVPAAKPVNVRVVRVSGSYVNRGRVRVKDTTVKAFLASAAAHGRPRFQPHERPAVERLRVVCQGRGVPFSAGTIAGLSKRLCSDGDSLRHFADEVERLARTDREFFRVQRNSLTAASSKRKVERTGGHSRRGKRRVTARAASAASPGATRRRGRPNGRRRVARKPVSK